MTVDASSSFVARVVAATNAAAAGGQPDPIEVTLRDDSRAELRPIRREDGDRLRAGLQLLSPRSRYLRFHAGVSELTDQQVRYLIDIDHRRHVAWVALDPEHPELPGMGVARYVRLEPETVAEAAVTVADEYQGRGLGTTLLTVLGAVAGANGVEIFRNYVLDANGAMLALFDELGATREREGPGVWRVDLPVAGDPDELPDSPAGRAIRELARSRPERPGVPAPVFPSLWFERLRNRDA